MKTSLLPDNALDKTLDDVTRDGIHDDNDDVNYNYDNNDINDHKNYNYDDNGNKLH